MDRFVRATFIFGAFVFWAQVPSAHAEVEEASVVVAGFAQKSVRQTFERVLSDVLASAASQGVSSEAFSEIYSSDSLFEETLSALRAHNSRTLEQLVRNEITGFEETARSVVEGRLSAFRAAPTQTAVYVTPGYDIRELGRRGFLQMSYAEFQQFTKASVEAARDDLSQIVDNERFQDALLVALWTSAAHGREIFQAKDKEFKHFFEAKLAQAILAANSAPSTTSSLFAQLTAGGLRPSEKSWNNIWETTRSEFRNELPEREAAREISFELLKRAAKYGPLNRGQFSRATQSIRRMFRDRARNWGDQSAVSLATSESRERFARLCKTLGLEADLNALNEIPTFTLRRLLEANPKFDVPKEQAKGFKEVAEVASFYRLSGRLWSLLGEDVLLQKVAMSRSQREDVADFLATWKNIAKRLLLKNGQARRVPNESEIDSIIDEEFGSSREQSKTTRSQADNDLRFFKLMVASVPRVIEKLAPYYDLSVDQFWNYHSQIQLLRQMGERAAEWIDKGYGKPNDCHLAPHVTSRAVRDLLSRQVQASNKALRPDWKQRLQAKQMDPLSVFAFFSASEVERAMELWAKFPEETKAREYFRARFIDLKPASASRDLVGGSAERIPLERSGFWRFVELAEILRTAEMTFAKLDIEAWSSLSITMDEEIRRLGRLYAGAFEFIDQSEVFKTAIVEIKRQTPNIRPTNIQKNDWIAAVRIGIRAAVVKELAADAGTSARSNYGWKSKRLNPIPVRKGLLVPPSESTVDDEVWRHAMLLLESELEEILERFNLTKAQFWSTDGGKYSDALVAERLKETFAYWQKQNYDLTSPPSSRWPLRSALWKLARDLYHDYNQEPFQEWAAPLAAQKIDRADILGTYPKEKVLLARDMWVAGSPHDRLVADPERRAARKLYFDSAFEHRFPRAYLARQMKVEEKTIQSYTARAFQSVLEHLEQIEDPAQYLYTVVPTLDYTGSVRYWLLLTDSITTFFNAYGVTESQWEEIARNWPREKVRTALAKLVDQYDEDSHVRHKRESSLKKATQEFALLIFPQAKDVILEMLGKSSVRGVEAPVATLSTEAAHVEPTPIEEVEEIDEVSEAALEAERTPETVPAATVISSSGRESRWLPLMQELTSDQLPEGWPAIIDSHHAFERMIRMTAKFEKRLREELPRAFARLLPRYLLSPTDVWSATGGEFTKQHVWTTAVLRISYLIKRNLLTPATPADADVVAEDTARSILGLIYRRRYQQLPDDWSDLFELDPRVPADMTNPEKLEAAADAWAQRHAGQPGGDKAALAIGAFVRSNPKLAPKRDELIPCLRELLEAVHTSNHE